METHRDFDSAEAMDALQRRAKEMTDRMENLITAGAPGEKIWWEREQSGVLIRRMPDDPLALRLSIGAAEQVEGTPTYFVFRGHPHHVRTLLRRVLAALESAL